MLVGTPFSINRRPYASPSSRSGSCSAVITSAGGGRNVTYEGILETAEAEGCDLIVMGSHGRQGVKALILGSVAQKVLTHANVPVLIVKG